MTGNTGMKGGMTRGIRRLRQRPLLALLALSVLVGVFFIAFPEVDIAVSGLFYGTEGFWMKKSALAQELRDVFVNVMIGISAVSVAAILYRLVFRRRLFKVRTARWLFVVLCFTIGPGLIANTIFKDHWGRPRPVQITEFGGATNFELPVFMDLDGEGCRRNCSFVSGEGSLAFMTGFVVLGFFSLSSPVAIALALAYGSAGAFFRIAMGGHFLSDTIFAALFMAMTAIMLYRLLLGPRALRLPTLSFLKVGAPPPAPEAVAVRRVRRQG